MKGQATPRHKGASGAVPRPPGITAGHRTQFQYLGGASRTQFRTTLRAAPLTHVKENGYYGPVSSNQAVVSTARSGAV